MISNTKISFTLSLIIILFLISSCNTQKKEIADIIFKGGTIYTASYENPVIDAVAVVGDKIIFIGEETEALKFKGDDTEIIDLENKTMIPGFIDAHGHFMAMGNSKLILDLRPAETYEDVLRIVEEAVMNSNPGEWIEGRGWHQDKWSGEKEGFVSGFPTHKKLSEISPDNPVFLSHASGHSAFVNSNAMNLAGISKKTLPDLIKALEGGEIMTDKDGNPTGILNENAEGLVLKLMPDKRDHERMRKVMDLAIQECHKNGITGFHDAGIDQNVIDLYTEYKDEGKLNVRIHAMLQNDPELLEKWFTKGPMIDTVDYLLNIRSVKLLADGALGNRGAWLIEEYSDKPGWTGLETTPMTYVHDIAEKCLDNGFQLCVHAIGDRANREVLDNYERAINKYNATDHRFRIEHAQHLNPDDIPRFAQLKVIAAMQAIHMSSDRPWAGDRLGIKRIKEGAYVWQKLLTSGAVIINGTDVPVEPVNPLACFYAAVSRKTLKGTPEGAYEPDQKMTREQALRSYTYDAAYGSFEEKIKGSIEVGKLADFAILDKDIMIIPEDEILKTKVVLTIFGGEVIYQVN